MAPRKGKRKGLGHYDPDKADHYSIAADGYDFRQSSRSFEDSAELHAAMKRTTKKHRTGAELMRDIYHSFVKVSPRRKERDEVSGAYLINHAIVKEIMRLEDYDIMRKMSVGDAEGSSIATASLEKDIDVIFDKLKKAEEMAQKMADNLSKIEELSDQEGDPDVDKMIEDLMNENQELENDLRSELDGQANAISDSLRQTMSEMADQADAEAQAQQWGMEKGKLARMPHKARMELGRRLNKPEFKRMAEVIGRFQNIAMSVVEQKKVESFEEIYDIQLGNNIEHMLPQEALSLTDDDLFADFARRYTEQSLMQYALRGTESTSKGGIIFVEDGSGSMQGDPAIWAKAIGLALLKIASVQHRDFAVIHFGGPGQFVLFDFDTSGPEVVLKFGGKEFVGFDAMVEFAEVGFNYAGTDFQTPLTEAMRILREQNDESGATKADIIFATDGQAGVTAEWMKEYEDTKEELAFKTYGFAIGALPQSEPLASICDAVATPKQLLDGTDLEKLFKAL